jgi:hypothetical protein
VTVSVTVGGCVVSSKGLPRVQPAAQRIDPQPPSPQTPAKKTSPRHTLPTLLPLAQLLHQAIQGLGLGCGGLAVGQRVRVRGGALPAAPLLGRQLPQTLLVGLEERVLGMWRERALVRWKGCYVRELGCVSVVTVVCVG